MATDRAFLVRSDAEIEKAIDAIRQRTTPVPSKAAVVRSAIMEKYERLVKPNGHGGRAGKKEKAP